MSERTPVAFKPSNNSSILLSFICILRSLRCGLSREGQMKREKAKTKQFKQGAP